jgi:hypothetical protein
VVITTSDETRLLGRDVPKLVEKLKAIDYDRYAVVAVFRGRKQGEEYGVEIQRLCLQDDVITIYAHFTDPEGLEGHPSVTSPYHLIRYLERD